MKIKARCLVTRSGALKANAISNSTETKREISAPPKEEKGPPSEKLKKGIGNNTTRSQNDEGTQVLSVRKGSNEGRRVVLKKKGVKALIEDFLTPTGGVEIEKRKSKH